jgi:hypothetical protein
MKSLALFALSAVSILVTYLLFEGGVAVWRGDVPGTSIGYRTVALIRGDSWRQGIEDDGEPNAVALADVHEIEVLLEALAADAVGLGNTPYKQLKTDASTMYYYDRGCKHQKPNVRKLHMQLVTRLFDPLDPVVAFWDEGRELRPEVAAFLGRYGFQRKRHSFNNKGDRTTLPLVRSDRLVLIAGDSVANGILLDDDETISSQLQTKDRTRQYINAGIPGSGAREIICNAEKAAENYAGAIEELIYVYCENDFSAGKPYGTPKEVIQWMETFVARKGIGKVTVVYTPFIYNILPQLTRFENYRGYSIPHHASEKRRLEAAVAAAGYRFIDYTDIALAENRAAGSMFAALALFVDHAHYSRAGTNRLVALLEAD